MGFCMHIEGVKCANCEYPKPDQIGVFRYIDTRDEQIALLRSQLAAKSAECERLREALDAAEECLAWWMKNGVRGDGIDVRDTRKVLLKVQAALAPRSEKPCSRYGCGMDDGKGVMMLCPRCDAKPAGEGE